MSKSGSQTTTTAIPKWQEDLVREAVDQAKGLNVPYAPYMGVDVVAQDPNINANVNSALSSFGMQNVGNILPPATTQGGITGYRSYDLYQDQLANLKENYPDIYRRIEAQTAESLPQANVVGQVNPVTGYPITPTPTNVGVDTSRHNDDDDNYFPPAPSSSNDSILGGSWEIDTSYNPIQDFTDWISGGYDYPEMTQSDQDYYNSEEFGS